MCGKTKLVMSVIQHAIKLAGKFSSLIPESGRKPGARVTNSALAKP